MYLNQCVGMKVGRCMDAMADAVDASGSKLLTMATFNSKGHGCDRLSFIKFLLEKCDILLVQEHWLFNNNISYLISSMNNVNVFGCSGMDENELVCGRPYGGCAIVWKRDIGAIFEPVESSW